MEDDGAVSRDDSAALAGFFWERLFHDEPREVVAVAFLDGRGRLTGYRAPFTGTLTRAPVEPRQILAAALLHGARALVVAHNHPSGDPGPSGEDQLFTRRLQEAGCLVGVDVLDHVVGVVARLDLVSEEGRPRAAAQAAACPGIRRSPMPRAEDPPCGATSCLWGDEPLPLLGGVAGRVGGPRTGRTATLSVYASTEERDEDCLARSPSCRPAVAGLGVGGDARPVQGSRGAVRSLPRRHPQLSLRPGRGPWLERLVRGDLRAGRNLPLSHPRAKKFYDWDCFQYDSRTLSIETNVRRLHEQLRGLKHAGYRRVMLATHSTGGVLALDVLVRALETPAGDLPHVAGVLAWATPINGLRPGVSFAGRALTRAGFSPETLPDLAAGSAYLRGLKARLKRYNARYVAVDDVGKGRMRFDVWFLQGQGDDMVVQSISRADAEREGWFWPGRSEVIETREGHTHNVGRAGTQPVPRYPAAFLNLAALVKLHVEPRYGEVFPDDAGVFTASLEARQVDVVEGLTYFADQDFPKAFTPSLAFLRRMYQGSFTRSRAVDEKLVYGFLSVLKQKAATPDEDLVRFFAAFVHEVLGSYDPAHGADVRRIGHGNSPVAQAILETAEVIRQAVVGYLRAHPESQHILGPYGGVDGFNSELVGFTARFLGSPHGPVQGVALSTLAASVPELSDDGVVASGADDRLHAYYLGGAYRELSAEAKARLGTLYTNLASRRPDIRRATLAALNTPVQYLGEERPAWVALGSDEPVLSLVATIRPGSDEANREQHRFAAEVVARAGASGRNTEAALKAMEKAERLIASSRDPALRGELKAELGAAVKASSFPAVERGYEPPLN